MAKFSAFQGNYVPSSSNVAYNMILQNSSNALVRATVQEVAWGGAASSSTPMQTHFARTSSSSTAWTGSALGNVQRLDQTLSVAGNALLFFSSLSSTVLPGLVAGALFGAAWNAYGGVVRWLAAPGEEWDLALTPYGIACINDLATPGTSSYSAVWTEF